MQFYTNGLYFSRDRSEVLLIEKRRPHWQAGKFNGIGGKLEPNETALAAMIREFREETGLQVTAWHHFLTLVGNGWLVYFFRAASELPSGTLLPPTDELPFWVKVNSLLEYPIIPNLSWIVPLALDPDLLNPVIINDISPPALTGHDGSVFG